MSKRGRKPGPLCRRCKKATATVNAWCDHCAAAREAEDDAVRRLKEMSDEQS